jgi:hypothetical protein
MTNTNRPSHHIFVVDGEGEKAIWTRIGAAWPHKAGGGFTVQLIPGIAVSGRFVIRPVKSDDNGGR